MQIVAFDTETARIRPGLQAPPPVCLQWTMLGRVEPEIIHCYLDERRALDWLEWALTTPDVLLTGHRVAFDMVAIMARWPHLTKLVFDAYAADRVTCTIVREKLHDIAQGKRRGREYNMAAVAERCKLPPVDKEDPWRLRYWELRDVPVDAWPYEAVHYAREDAQRTLDIHLSRNDFPDEYRQARADLWLYLTTAWGMRTDPAQVRRFYEQTKAELQEEKRQLQKIGLVRFNGSKDTKAAAERMAAIHAANGTEPERTGTGKISLNAEACEESGDPFLVAYARYTSHGTILSRVKRLFHGVDTPIQASFDSLVETGRTSCRQGDVKIGEEVTAWGAQTQNVHRAKGLRECFVAREGSVFIGSDFDKCELHTVSQVCIWMFEELRIDTSRVKLAQVLNAGHDPHLALGGKILGISYEEAFARRKEKVVKDARQAAKPANFGFPGGLGINSFVAFAKSTYGVVLTPFEAKRLKDDWLHQFSEFQVYFEVIRQRLYSIGKDDKGVEKLRTDVLHPMSYRLRGKVPFTVACNSYFQGLAADLAKDAGFRVAYECYCDPTSPLYGYRIVAFIHDELIIEGPRERCHEAAVRLKKLMEDAGAHWCPDVPVRASPSVMYRWSKDVDETLHPVTGEYIPHEEMLELQGNKAA